MDTGIRKQVKALRELVDAVLGLKAHAFRADIDRMQRLAVTAAPMVRRMEAMAEAAYFGGDPFVVLEEDLFEPEEEPDGDESEGCNPPDAIVYRCDTLQ